MDLREWREKRRGERKTLPSGLTVTVRRCDLMDLAEQGGIPTPLVAMAEPMVATGVRLSVPDFPKYAPVINLVVKACLVDPVVADTADETHVAITELSLKDRLAIYRWANEGAARLLPFREAGRGDGETVRDGQDLRDETEPDTGDR
jgi:hypothetical protein